MTTITNPALFSYKLGVSKYGLFKKVPFMVAYWEKDNGFQYDFINLIQLSANRMDFAATEMRPKDRKGAFVYFSAYKYDEISYQLTMDPAFNENNFVCYVVFRAKDLGTISKHSKLLIGDMHKIDMKSIYTLPVKDYMNAKPVFSSMRSATSYLGEFYAAYETLKSCLISALVNYEDMFE